MECNVLTCQDISDFRKLVALQKENRIIQIFSSTIAHETLTPLRCVIQMTDQLKNLKDDNSNPSDSQIKRKNYAALINSTCEMMLGQIHASLDYNLVNMNMF
jgi:signal transduction histidine kinase